MSIDYSDMAFPKPTWKKKEKKQRKQWQRCSRKREVAPVQRKKKRKKRKYKKVKSIMQPKEDKRCFLCMLLDNNFQEHVYLEEHHVLFGDTKWISDAYGLRVNLCRKHHRESEVAVHDHNELAKLLMKIAQERFMEEYPDLNWMEIVGTNYLEEA